ncbi:class II fumarate hydratase [Vibrio fortis]
MTQEFRIEKDSMGEVKVPANALYQAQTQRAADNFSFSSHTMPASFIQALAFIKQAAANTNAQLGHLEGDIAHAIIDASQEIIDGQHLEQFPVDVYQTGSGTSSNMNANEVIATLASRALQGDVSPNDHVNMGQSSNDVVPTAIQVSVALTVEKQLLPALAHLSDVLATKQMQVADVVKTGRTHLMDAMPITLSQELGGWKFQIDHAKQGIESSLEAVKALAQGGTAVGTGINADPRFADAFAHNLSQTTKLQFAMAAAQVIGNDTTITVAGQSGNFQLNVMLPVIAHNVLESIELLSNSSVALADKAVATFTVRQDNLDEALAKNPILVTALNPVIGYLKAADIAKKAYKEGLPILDVAERETDIPREELASLLNPSQLTKGGIAG